MHPEACRKGLYAWQGLDAWHGMACNAPVHGRLKGIPKCMAGLGCIPGLEGMEGLELNLWAY